MGNKPIAPVMMMQSCRADDVYEEISLVGSDGEREVMYMCMLIIICSVMSILSCIQIIMVMYINNPPPFSPITGLERKVILAF